MLSPSPYLARRQPLLPARQVPSPYKKQCERPRPATISVLVALLLLLGGGALTLARQRQQVPSSGSRPRPPAPEDHDSEHELHLLHNEPPPEFCEKPSVPVVCAHGGDASAAPPNTARAFQAAADAGVRCVEVDAALTRDGHLVVLHSRDLARLLGEDPNASPAPSEPEGPEEGRLLRKRQRRWLPQVGDYTLEQLQQLRYDSGEGVELVSSVVEAMLPYMDHVILDIKTYRQGEQDVDTDEVAQAVLDVVRSTSCGACLVWAKADAVIVSLKERFPEQRAGYIVMNDTAAARAAGLHLPNRMPHVEALGVHYAMVDPVLVADAQSRGKQVLAWTANTASMMRSVLDAGVDAIVTNHPRKLQAAIQSRLRKCEEQRRR